MRALSVASSAHRDGHLAQGRALQHVGGHPWEPLLERRQALRCVPAALVLCAPPPLLLRARRHGKERSAPLLLAATTWCVLWPRGGLPPECMQCFVRASDGMVTYTHPHIRALMRWGPQKARARPRVLFLMHLLRTHGLSKRPNGRQQLREAGEGVATYCTGSLPLVLISAGCPWRHPLAVPRRGCAAARACASGSGVASSSSKGATGVQAWGTTRCRRSPISAARSYRRWKGVSVSRNRAKASGAMPALAWLISARNSSNFGISVSA